MHWAVQRKFNEHFVIFRVNLVMARLFRFRSQRRAGLPRVVGFDHFFKFLCRADNPLHRTFYFADRKRVGSRSESTQAIRDYRTAMTRANRTP
ncbi:MAG: hypothetical protein JWM99_5202, partial [Verrucomicrobiales bacterium]|nr:hypothetical protein [Verrucomicrobiales bacterium]